MSDAIPRIPQTYFLEVPVTVSREEIKRCSQAIAEPLFYADGRPFYLKFWEYRNPYFNEADGIAIADYGATFPSDAR